MEPVSANDEADEILLTDRDLVCLYMKYPEMSLAFDNDDIASDEEDQSITEHAEAPSEPFSSPASSWQSGSTTQTTPLRPEPIAAISAGSDEYQDLGRLLQAVDLPATTIIYFASLGNRILQIGGLLFPVNGEAFNRHDQSEVLEHCQILQSSLHFSCSKVEGNCANLAFITQLAPFTVTPYTEDLWSNYRQMAELVIKHTEMPCKEERDILVALTHLFDAYVYNSALQASRQKLLDQTIQTSLDSIYNVLMTISEKYNKWCKAMRELRTKHLQPVMMRIWASPKTRRDIEDFAAMREAEGKAARESEDFRVLPVDDRLLETLRFNAVKKQRKAGEVKVKTRFRREHTL